MNKLILGAFVLGLGLSSCGEQKSTEMSAEEAQKLELEIETLESEASEIDDLKNEIDATSKELDDAINDL